MRTYYELLNHLKITFEEDERVNNVVTGDHEEWRKDMFILTHIEFVDSPLIDPLNTSTIRYNIQIEVLDIRLVNKENVKDRFWHNDNRHDSWNDTISILNIARNKVIKDHLGNDITLVTATNAEPITYAYGNGLDGWRQVWTIDVPDNFTSIC